MKPIRFASWAEVLVESQLPEREKQSWEITLRWYLSFCRRGRVEVTVQSARDFIAWAQQEKQAQPWQVEGWKEAIRWFFREAKTTATEPKAKAEHPIQSRTSNPQPPTSNIQCNAKAIPAWKTAFLTVVRRRHYSYRTEQSYLVWLERFARFCRSDDLGQRGPEDLKAFLDDLALDQRLSASSQRQALNAVVFLLREVFGKELGDFSDYRRAKVRTHAPSWLTAEEVACLLKQLNPRWALLTCVAFGGGLRLMELLRLRVHPVR